MNYNYQHNSHRYAKLKFLLISVALFAVMAWLNHCVFYEDVESEMADTEDSEEFSDVNPDDDVLTPDSLERDSVFELDKRNHIKGVRSFTLDFPDENDVQLEAAKKNGVIPLDSREEIDNYLQTGKLVYIGNSPYFHLDNLTHSMPYLTPHAYHLVNTICLNFIDSLQSKGMQPHIPIVTSVLRTMDDINKLRRRNGNSVERSAHRYGTTVDITYNRFMPIMYDGSLNLEPTRYDFQQKLVLAEVLRDLRLQGLCYVKYERRQACFHLTIR